MCKPVSKASGFSRFRDDNDGVVCTSSTHSAPAPIGPLPADVEAPPARETITVEWRRLNAWVAKKRADAKKKVLVESWGTASPGQVLSLMGPSGSGKTTLLNILAERPTLGDYGCWSGAVLANGRPSLPRSCVGYVMQKDIFFDDLTVREHLRCTAALRLPPTWSIEQKQAEFERVVALLRLDGVLDSKVGTNTSRGISGGELKRLNIATELLAQPTALLLDEPLSGLDSALATTVIDVLGTIASTRATTVIMSVHQPSAAMWDRFDRLLLLSPGGHTAFLGAAADAAAHASTTLGEPQPTDRSAAEWLIDLVATESAQREMLLEAFRSTPVPPDPPAGCEIAARPMPPMNTIVRALLQRNVGHRREAERKPLEWILTFGLAIVFAGVFQGVGAERFTRQTDYVTLLFFFLAHWSWMPLFKFMSTYPQQRDVLTRERASSSYPISAWYIANLLGDWSLAWVHPLVFYMVAYPIARLPLRSAPALFAINMLNMEVSMAVGSVITASVFDMKRATSIAIVAMAFFMLAGGFFVDLRQPGYPPWLSSLSYFSYWTYSFGLLMNAALPSPDEFARFDATLSRYSFSEATSAANVGVLACVAGICRVAACMVIVRSKQLRFS